MTLDLDVEAHPGSTTSLESELERLHRNSFAWALICCRWDPTAVEDVLHDAYVKVLSGKARLESRSTFKTWLFGVIRLTALEHRTRTTSRTERLERWARTRSPGVSAVPQSDVSFVDSERSVRLVDALMELPRRQREVLHLVFYDGMSVSEAARALGVSVGSARTHYARGKARLRSTLTEVRDEETAAV